jgi:hypothetical protein
VSATIYHNNVIYSELTITIDYSVLKNRIADFLWVLKEQNVLFICSYTIQETLVPGGANLTFCNKLYQRKTLKSLIVLALKPLRV